MSRPIMPATEKALSEFNEDQWIRILFLISDTQDWLNELQQNHFYQLPVSNKKKLFRKSFYLSASTLAHIVERHYYKIRRYPECSKFTIPLAEVLHFIKSSFEHPASPLNGTMNVQRVMDAGKTIGYDQSGQATSQLTVISDQGGKIVTAFPGIINH